MNIQKQTKHPAKFTDTFIPLFADILIKNECNSVLDPFAGTGKIGKIKEYGYNGIVYANEIEREWIEPNAYNCDYVTICDAESLNYINGFFDAICTSPTYGNRMADHHNAKDGSSRNTYTHCIGHTLSAENTGAMQWGENYKQKHIKIYAKLVDMLKSGGIFILNISDHIRKGERINVSEFHYNTLVDLGFRCIQSQKISTPRLRYGDNSNLRIDYENIYVFKKEQ